MEESARMGVSKHIPHHAKTGLPIIPDYVTIGESWVFLVHPKVPYGMFENDEGEMEMLNLPAIFSAFVPTHVEYVVQGDETKEQLDKIVERGITLVKVERKQEEEKAENTF
jgi:hypothetical protein